MQYPVYVAVVGKVGSSDPTNQPLVVAIALEEGGRGEANSAWAQCGCVFGVFVRAVPLNGGGVNGSEFGNKIQVTLVKQRCYACAFGGLFV